MTRNLVVKLAATLGSLVISLATLGSAAADDGRGEELFALCQQCHGADGGGRPMTLAPAIAGLDLWYVEAQLNAFRSGARGTDPGDIPGMRMHPMAMWLASDSDLKAVASYVASLPPTNPEATITGGNLDNGKEIYATCAACHGEKGEGNQTTNSPPLAGASDWYTTSTLERFKSRVRGSNPDNPNEMMMQGMSMMLTDEQAIKDVIAYISTLRR